MLSRLSCVHAQGCRQLCLQSCKNVASTAARQSRELHELSYRSWHSRTAQVRQSSVSIKVRVIFIYCLKRSSIGIHKNSSQKHTSLVYQHIYKTRYNLTVGSSLNRQCVRTISCQYIYVYSMSTLSSTFHWSYISVCHVYSVQPWHVESLNYKLE